MWDMMTCYDVGVQGMMCDVTKTHILPFIDIVQNDPFEGTFPGVFDPKQLHGY